MAFISEKCTRRYRMQFSMRRESYELYQALLCRASELGVVIDFASDFEIWFAGQLDQVRHELQTLELKSVKKGGTHDTE
jgi:hypothetical protein